MKYLVSSLLLFLSVPSLLGGCGKMSGEVADLGGDEEKHDDHIGGDDRAEHDREGEGSDHVELSADGAKEAGIVVSTAALAPLRETLVLPAELRFDADRVAEVSPQVSGRIIKLYAGEGDVVSKGAPLALLSSREIADLKAGFLTAAATVKLAQQALDREETLFADQITSQADLLTARAAYSEAEARHNAVENQLHSFGITHADLDGLESAPDGTLANIPLHAPIGGVIVRRNATLGAAVSAEDPGAEPLFTIVDDSVLWADIAVYKQDTRMVEKGASVSLKSETGALLSEGVITAILPLINETSRTATARMIVDNANQTVRPGQFATAEIQTSHAENRLQVPSDAIVEVEGRKVVFVPEGDGFEPRNVQPGLAVDGRTVISAGLSEGDDFVSEGAFTLKAQLEKDAFGDGHVH